MAETTIDPTAESGAHTAQAQTPTLVTIVMIAVFFSGFTMLVVAVIAALVTRTPTVATDIRD